MPRVSLWLSAVDLPGSPWRYRRDRRLRLWAADFVVETPNIYLDIRRFSASPAAQIHGAAIHDSNATGC
jgi:hypothetical protein